MFKKLISSVLAFIFALSLPAAAWAGSKTGPGETGGLPSATIVVVIDGLLQKHLESSTTPNIAGLFKSGASVQKVINAPDNLSGTISLLLAGERSSGEDALAGFYAEKKKNGVKTAVIDGTGGELASLSRGASIVNDGPFKPGGKEIMEAALKEITTSGDIFCLIVLPGPAQGSKPGNTQSLSMIDNQVGLLLYHLQNDDQIRGTVLAVTGSKGDLPAAIQGRGVRAGITVPAASLADVSATIKYVSYQTSPDRGMVLYEAVNPQGSISRNNLLEQRINELSKAYIQATREIETMRTEQTEVKRQQSRLDREKAQYTEVIKKQKKEIDGLQLKLKLVKIGGYLLFMVFIITLYAEYRFLKKRFMFFT